MGILYVNRAFARGLRHMALVSLIVILLAPTVSCKHSEELQRDQVTRAGHTWVPSIRPLDDPANPYKGQYSQWDYWLADNIQTDPNFDYHKIPDNWSATEGCVDAQGWLIPRMEIIRQEQEQLSGINSNAAPIFDYVNAAGEVPAGMIAAELYAANLVAKPFYMPIPAWVASKEFESAVLPINGDVILLEKDAKHETMHADDDSTGAASGSDDDGASHHLRHDGMVWRCYSQTGASKGKEVIGRLPWSMVYGDPYQDNWQSSWPPIDPRWNNGITFLVDKDSGELFKAFDFDGHELSISGFSSADIKPGAILPGDRHPRTIVARAAIMDMIH